MNRPKAIGTAGETGVVHALHRLGYPDARRIALAGAADQGDIGAAWQGGRPALTFEIKAGKAGQRASDAQIAAWLTETDRERLNAGSDLGILVTARPGIGPDRAHLWWAHLEHAHVAPGVGLAPLLVQIRLTLENATRVLQRAGYLAA